MDKTTQERINKKFDICYVPGKEFAKYPVLHELEGRHGVGLGQMYKTMDSAKVFINYIAERHHKHSQHGRPSLIGGGTDGASVNVSEQNGMMGKLQEVCHWLFAWQCTD